MSGRVGVVGGGLAGLAAAYYLQQAGLTPLVLEASSTFGGKVQTEHAGRLVLEQGPDSFLIRKPWAQELARSLGLAEDIVPLPESGRGSAIYFNGRLHRIPDGLMLGLPTAISPLLRSRLLSPGGKLRALLDLVLPQDLEEGDRPLGAIVARRFGHEVLERIVEPLLGGIYAGDSWAMSAEATFPQILELEKAHRSLLLGARDLRRSAPKTSPAPMFATLREGLAQLTDKLAAALPPAALRRGAPVVALRSRDLQYVLELKDGEEIEVDAAVLAVPAPQAGDILRELAPQAAVALYAINYASLAVASLAFEPEDVPPLRGSGFLAPRGSGLSITACTYVVNKWPHESEGATLLRCYLGRAGQDPLGQSDEEIVEAVRADLRRVLAIERPPRIARVYRWPDAMPQYAVGHRQRIRSARQALSHHPLLQLAGAAYEGVGMPDVVRQAKEAAHAIQAVLGGGGLENVEATSQQF